MERKLTGVLDLLIEYRTVAGPSEVTEIEKKSKFIAYVEPVESVAEAEEFIARISKMNWDATHNVYAYVIGPTGEQQKCSDDGEPSGTSGLPTLEAIKSLELVNVAIVVTRYFGGILLGRGGLIRAYGGAARSGLLAAGIVKKVPHRQVFLTVDYSLSGKVENDLINSGIAISDTSYMADVTYTLNVLPERLDEVKQRVQELTADQFKWSLGEEVYHTIKVSE